MSDCRGHDLKIPRRTAQPLSTVTEFVKAGLMKVNTVTNNVGCQRDLAQFDARRLRSHCQRCTRRHTLVEENFEEELSVLRT